MVRSKSVRALDENVPTELSASVSIQGRPVALLPGRLSCLDLTSASLSVLADAELPVPGRWF
jgi:hypothetical protein